MNDLDRIYRDWKSKGGKQQNDLHLSHGVPNPHFDGEDDTDYSKIRVCESCGSMNVSVDMSTNETFCNDCKENSKEPHRVNFEKKMEDQIEQEKKSMEEAIKRGTQFGTTD